MAELPKTLLHEPPRLLVGADLLREAALRPLADLPDPPARLFLAGRLPARCVAIVGTRRSDPEADRFARQLAYELGRAGIGTISGGALGIDAAAHRGALDAEAPTVAVLATHPTWAYPARHAELFGAIVRRGGALLGEHEDHRPLRGYFLLRNRLIAALADATVVVQAPLRSGALSTARVAFALGRPVLAVPSSPWDPRARGNDWLFDQGALRCQGAADVGEVLGLSLSSDAARSDTPEVSPVARAIWTELGARPRHADELALVVGEPAAIVQRALLELTLAGAASTIDGARYTRASR